MTLISAALSLALAASAAPELGKPAPDFSLPSHDGKTVTLAGQKGKWVVLEWFNKDCPFVKKHYGSKNMQGLQAKYGKKGVKWFSIISSKPGKQGHMTAGEAKAEIKSAGMASTMLLDPSGDAGRAYGAKTTPHMFVIDPKGTLVYMGGIDDTPSADAADIPKSKNLVAAALDEALAGKPVTTGSSKPYGCSVKY
jgi:peroxiredoxin